MPVSRQRSRISSRSTRRRRYSTALEVSGALKNANAVRVGPSAEKQTVRQAGSDSHRLERRSRSELPLKLAVIGLVAAVIANPLFWAWLSSRCPP